MLILAGIIILYYIAPTKGLINIIRSPIVLVGAVSSNMGSLVQTWWFGISHGSELVEKSKDQEKRIAQLQFYLSQTLFSQNSVEESSLGDFIPLEKIQAQVLAQSNVAGNKVLIINKGTEHGIYPGSAAATSQGVFIGKIISADASIASILPTTSPSSAIAATISGDLEFQAVVKGNGGLGLIMELIPQDAELTAGDIVTTSILEENTPRGLLIGTISSVNYTQGQLFQTAVLTPFLSLQNIQDIEIFLIK